MQTINFNGRSYSVEVLETCTREECLNLYNRVAAITGQRQLATFRDKQTAVDRTWNVLKGLTQRPSEVKPKEEVTERRDNVVSLKVPPARNVRKRYFKFPLSNEGVKTAKAGSLRGRVVVLLKQGGKTFNDVLAEIKRFDADRGVAPHNDERRAYEVIRIIHYQLGYGIDHDQTTGVLTLIEE